MKSFLYFFCGTSVHYERRFLLICSTTRKVQTYVWLDFLINLRALERERDEKDVGVFSWYILFETVFIFLSTRKSRICVFVCHHLSPGGYVCTLNSTHTTTQPFPFHHFLYSSIHGHLEGRSVCVKLVTTMKSRLVAIFSAIMAVSGHITVLWGLQMEKQETHKDQNNLNKPVVMNWDKLSFSVVLFDVHWKASFHFVTMNIVISVPQSM